MKFTTPPVNTNVENPFDNYDENKLHEHL